MLEITDSWQAIQTYHTQKELSVEQLFLYKPFAVSVFKSLRRTPNSASLWGALRPLSILFTVCDEVPILFEIGIPRCSCNFLSLELHFQFTIIIWWRPRCLSSLFKIMMIQLFAVNVPVENAGTNDVKKFLDVRRCTWYENHVLYECRIIIWILNPLFDSIICSRKLFINAR